MLLKNNEDLLWEMHIQIKQDEINLAQMRSNFRLISEEEGSYLNPFSTIITESNDSISLSEFTSSNNKLIFRFSHLDCNSCVDSQIVIIKEFSEYFDGCMAIFGYYDEIGKLNKFKRINDLDVDVFNVERINDNINFPYFFILTSENRMEHIFFPEKEFSDLTREYIRNILKYL